MQTVIIPTQRLSGWFVWARPYDAKVSKWLKQVKFFFRKKALIFLCKICMVIYTFCNVASY